VTDPKRTVLVVVGAGMLLPAVQSLLTDGATVVVARRPRRAGEHPQLIPVAADWAYPEDMADALHAVLGTVRPAEALLWVHSPYGKKVHEQLDRLLDRRAVVVHLWGSSGSDPGGRPYRLSTRSLAATDRSCSVSPTLTAGGPDGSLIARSPTGRSARFATRPASRASAASNRGPTTRKLFPPVPSDVGTTEVRRVLVDFNVP
jgi:hypothetical protein